MSFEVIDVKDLQANPWKMIGDEWMLITAEKAGKVNTMTASWGGVGIMWGKTVATVYIRPQSKGICGRRQFLYSEFFRRAGEEGNGPSGQRVRQGRKR